MAPPGRSELISGDMMPKTIVYEARTERLEILSPDGIVDRALLPEVDTGLALRLYEHMVRMRAYDTKALRLQRQGRMGTWPPSLGQEATQAAVGLAMDEKDWLIPSFREPGVMVAHGVPAHLIYLSWAGDERGTCYPEGVRCFPPAVPVGSQWQHGTGVGLSLKLRGEAAAAVVFGGDGSTSEGDFHEAINAAGVFKTNTVFVIQNNQWAISVPLSRQTAAESLAQKSHAYGVPGIQVDGNDVFAVTIAVTEALKRARSGEGPTLIEALTYRVGDHTTADDATRYRDEAEVRYWEERDPIRRLRRFLSAENLWDEAKEAALLEEVGQWVDTQVEAFEATPRQAPESIFDHMYADLPPHVQQQRQELLEELSQ